MTEANDSSTQIQKAARFRELHQGPDPFIIANPWDAGSARVLAGMGFAALATSSGGFAGTLGRRDGRIERDEALAHARAVVNAVDIPVSADLENGFGDAPYFAAETVTLAAGTGLVGCSIEDSTGNPEKPLYGFEESVARIAASVEAATSVGFGFTLTARAEGFLRGVADLEDVIARLQAYEAAGADVLMAPGLPDLDAVKAVCAAVSKPVNFMVGVPGKSFPLADLAAAGVRRVSLATSLYRAAMTGLIDAATEAKESGTFGYVDTSIPTPTLAGYMKG
ncbi:MAG: isocitrate lyase/phosphoenolpyruvate mutase family protein [Rhodospirillaceae bacterium]|jgi:2-methylisocitrate lyase-like PEP mutase family enzyme|nr:isocitrate lyase/phosphoenolpyruvate mutase family protein [Rhodospirillaceae bacterium]MBT5663700.1 isocitrate lyase/phosphoenolpyruvate mutase family protein [Rhodospirillaceae bacterium]MBT5811234.1 isocitrate lyase/phosphoenolpyruvate mutase family protein [Rhodospirillaceae bacterium]